jgi:hypothetical protein
MHDMDKQLPTTSLILPAIGLNCHQHQCFIVLLVAVTLFEFQDDFFAKM